MLAHCSRRLLLLWQIDEEGDAGEEGAAFRRHAEHTAKGSVAAAHVSGGVVPPMLGPSFTMDVIEGEWDGLLADTRVISPAAAAPGRPRPESVPRPTPAAQPSEDDAAGLNKRQRRLEKRRLAAEREAAIKQAVRGSMLRFL